VLLEDRSLAICHLLSHSLVDVEEVACALVAAATKSIFHNLLLGGNCYSVVVKLPPKFLGAIEEVSVVVPNVCNSIMDHHSMKVVWSLLQLGEGLLQSIFIALDFLLKLRRMFLCLFFEHGQDFESCL